MIPHILSKYNIDSYAFVDGSICTPANLRLHASLPKDARVIYMLFPYYTENSCKGISKYAAVHDYHGFARLLFSDLEDYLKKTYPDCFAKGFSDHSPFLECDGAARAGLGIIGKNSLLINEKYSSFVFIGELVTSLSEEALRAEGIPKGNGTLSFCESCGLCCAACPSGSIEGGGRDTCASAVSQKKGELTKEEKDILIRSKSIWGCDICQTVCPHTKAAAKGNTLITPIDYFKSSAITKDPIQALEEMSPEEFSLYPFAWRKPSVIKRNIEIIRSRDSGDTDNG